MKECATCRRCLPDHLISCPDDGAPLVSSLSGGPLLEGRYQLETRLGQGGMGIVFKARHTFLKTVHAIKIILPDLIGNAPELATRFRQEAMAAAAIRHPNIVAVTDFGMDGGRMPFLVMEFVKGASLHEVIAAEGRLSVSRSLEIMGAIAAGVGAAHKQGIIHRDLKPHNIMLQEGLLAAEAVKVMDFGLAKIKSGELLGSFIAAQTTGMMGSPYYMAPEQWSDEEPEARADIYSLGVMLYQMLAGEVPFKGSSIPSIMKKHLTEEPPRFSGMGVSVPPEIEAVVRAALSKEQDARPPTAESFINQLREAFKLSPALSDTQVSAHDMSSVAIQESEASEMHVGVVTGQSLNLAAPEQAEEQSDKGTRTVALPLSNEVTVYLKPEGLSTDREDKHRVIRLRLKSKALIKNDERIFEDQIVHNDYERLWRSFMHTEGGRNLLTGYGPFGGTTLVRCAVAKARDELQRRHRGAALLVFFFKIISETKEGFKLKATKFGLDQRDVPSALDHNPDLRELIARAGHAQTADASVINFDLISPQGDTFFNPQGSAIFPEAANRKYDFSDFVADLNAFFKEQKSAKALRQIVLRLVNSEHLPAQVVFIFDPIKRLETLETLSQSEFFSNHRIRVVAVARKEDYDHWHNAERRLKVMDFSKWYVPCLWQVNFSEALFDTTSEVEASLRLPYEIFSKHLQYKGRGAFGRIKDELRQPMNLNYGDGTSFIEIADLAERAETKHNAWLQDVLDLNWNAILSNLFVGREQDERTDRARQGIYCLLDWMAGLNKRFSEQEIFDSCQQAPITISDDAETTRETIRNLLYVLTRNNYLESSNNSYRVIWDKHQPPKCRRVNLKRRLPTIAKMSPAAVAPLDPIRSQRIADTHLPTLQPEDKQGLPESVSVVSSQTPATVTSLQVLSTIEDLPSIESQHTRVASAEKPVVLTSPVDTPRQHKVFVSYSHADKAWLERLRVHLKWIERQGLIELWDDTRIKAGARWKPEIKKAIDSAKVAILLVSKNFLASDFIDNDELPPLLAASEEKGTIIIPVIVSPCLFMKTTLSQFQAINSLANPLTAMNENQQDELFVKVAEAIDMALRA